MTKEETQEFVNKMFEPTAENAIRDMKMSKLLFITKDGKFCSYIANDYIEKMSKYSVHCKEEEQKNWTKTIEQLIFMAGEVDDYTLLSELHSYEDAAEIMERISNGCSWEDISKLTHEQGHSGMTISLLGQKMLHFSPNGIQFVEEVIGDRWIKLLENLNNAYKDEKKKEKKKQLALSKK